MTTNSHPHSEPGCRAVSEVLSRVGDKWTVLIVKSLQSAGGDGRRRRCLRTTGFHSPSAASAAAGAASLAVSAAPAISAMSTSCISCVQPVELAAGSPSDSPSITFSGCGGISTSAVVSCGSGSSGGLRQGIGNE